MVVALGTWECGWFRGGFPPNWIVLSPTAASSRGDGAHAASAGVTSFWQQDHTRRVPPPSTTCSTNAKTQRRPPGKHWHSPEAPTCAPSCTCAPFVAASPKVRAAFGVSFLPNAKPSTIHCHLLPCDNVFSRPTSPSPHICLVLYCQVRDCLCELSHLHTHRSVGRPHGCSSCGGELTSRRSWAIVRASSSAFVALVLTCADTLFSCASATSALAVSAFNFFCSSAVILFVSDKHGPVLSAQLRPLANPATYLPRRRTSMTRQPARGRGRAVAASHATDCSLPPNSTPSGPL